LFWFADVHVSTAHSYQYYGKAAQQIKSVLAVPLCNNAGDVIAALQVSRCDAGVGDSAHREEFTQEDIHVLESAATLTQLVSVFEKVFHSPGWSRLAANKARTRRSRAQASTRLGITYFHFTGNALYEHRNASRTSAACKRCSPQVDEGACS
jgi:hypothetical protein